MNSSTFAWHAATQTQTSNVLEVKCLQIFYILRMSTINTSNEGRFLVWNLLSSFQSRYSSALKALFLTAFKATSKLTNSIQLNLRYFELWVCGFRPLTFHIYLSIWNLVYQCDVQNKKENMWRDPGVRRSQECCRFTPNKRLSGSLPGLWSCHKSTATLYCTLDSECGLFRSRLAWGQSAGYSCSINICNAGSL